MKYIKVVLDFLTKNFLLNILIFGIVSYFFPVLFKSFFSYLNYLLGLTMFFMGLNLRARDFKYLFLNPFPTLLGVSCQILIMPTLGFIIATLFNFPPQVSTGFILLGSCPGGVASNVLVYLASGNLPLSVVMTSITTLLAPITLPFFIFTYAKKWVSVNAFDLFLSTLQIILIPVICGIIVSFLFPSITKKTKSLSTPISSFLLIIIVSTMISVNRESLTLCAKYIFFGVLLFNLFAIFLGYLIPHFLKVNEKSSRAICIEIAIQNAALGVSIAVQHFSPVSGVPSVIYAIVALFTGSILATFFSSQNNIS